MRKARRAAHRAALPRSIHTLSFRASDRCHWRGNPFPAPAGAESLASLCEAAQCSPRSKYPWGAHRVVRSEAKLRWREAPEGETGGAEPRPYAPSIEIPCVIYVSGRCGHRPLRKDRRWMSVGRSDHAVERSGTSALGVHPAARFANAPRYTVRRGGALPLPPFYRSIPAKTKSRKGGAMRRPSCFFWGESMGEIYSLIPSIDKGKHGFDGQKCAHTASSPLAIRQVLPAGLFLSGHISAPTKLLAPASDVFSSDFWFLRRRLAGASQGEKGKKRRKDTLSGVFALVNRWYGLLKTVVRWVYLAILRKADRR